MREIKFRAWDAELNKMYCGEQIEGESNLSAWLSYGELAIYRIDDGEYTELKPLQFTGVHDIHGVEIYDGDIVKIWEEDELVPNRDSGGGIVDFNKYEGFSQLGTISYHESSCVYETKKHLVGTKFDSYVPLDYFINREVVGNIHQHLCLLEQEDPS